MKITIEHEPMHFDDFGWVGDNEYDYNTYATLEASSDSNVYAVVAMCAKALEIEGFDKEMVLNALYNYALTKANEENIVLTERDD